MCVQICNFADFTVQKFIVRLPQFTWHCKSLYIMQKIKRSFATNCSLQDGLTSVNMDAPKGDPDFETIGKLEHDYHLSTGTCVFRIGK